MKTGFKIILIIITVLVVVYLLLPYIVRDYVNKTIADFEDYQGKVHEVDLALFRGGYVFKNIVLERTSEEEAVDYLEIERLGFSIDWGSLFKGKIVADIHVQNPVIHVIPVEPVEPDTVDLLDLVKELIPIRINRLVVENGQINFIDYQTDPRVNVYLNDLNLVAINLSNIDSDYQLPSSISLTGTSIGGGSLKVDMKADFLRDIPNIDMDLTFEEIDLTAFNEVTQAYAKFQFDTGVMNLYTEVAIRDGIINGYVTPVLEEVSILSDDPDEDKSLLQRIWEGALDIAASILESPPKEEHIATRVEIYGDLEDPETPVWPVIVNIFRNAFIEAFEKGLEGRIDFEDVSPEGQ
jgi:hypothetical protein